MPNAENIIKNSERTPKERQEIARAGGIASGEARRRKKSMREWAEILGSISTPITQPDGSKIEGDMDGLAVANIYKIATGKGTKASERIAAFRQLADLKGELKTNISVDDGAIVINVKDKAEAKDVNDIINRKQDDKIGED